MLNTHMSDSFFQEWRGDQNVDIRSLCQIRMLLNFTYAEHVCPTIILVLVDSSSSFLCSSGDGLALEAAIRFTRQSVEIDEDNGISDYHGKGSRSSS